MSVAKGHIYGAVEIPASLDVYPCFEPSCHVMIVLCEGSQNGPVGCTCPNPGVYCMKHRPHRCEVCLDE